MEEIMVNRILRGIAGALILFGFVMGQFVHPGFYFITAFVGLNLFQSAFSNWCPMIAVLKQVGVKD